MGARTGPQGYEEGYVLTLTARSARATVVLTV
jgi:hypothetical protein